MTFININGNPPGEGAISRMTMEEWLESSPTPNTSFEKFTLKAPSTSSYFATSLRRHPDIETTGRLICFLSRARREPNPAEAIKMHSTYRDLLETFKPFCALPVFISARSAVTYLTSKATVRVRDSHYDFGEILKESDLLVLRNFFPMGHATNDRLNEIVVDRLWEPKITVIFAQETASFSSVFPFITASENSAITDFFEI